MPCSYVLYSDTTGRFYKGSTRGNDIHKRFHAHNNGEVRSTKAGRPWRIMLVETYDDYTSARKRELFFKDGYWAEVDCR